MASDFISPTADHHMRFLISFLFAGDQHPDLASCVERAYLDLSRTAHRVGAGANAPVRKQTAHRLVESLLGEALQQNAPWTADAFDAWHQASCNRLCSHYEKAGYKTFRMGQAQKWINMSVKYALSLGSIGKFDIKDNESLRLVAHVPLDNYILSAFANFGARKFPCAWSRLENYSQYLDFQKWIRDRFPKNAPLDVEFHLWIIENSRRRTVGPLGSTSARRLKENPNGS